MYQPDFLDGFDRLVAFDAETTGKRTPDAEFIRRQPFAWKPPGVIIEVGFVEMLREGEGWRKGETWRSRVNPEIPLVLVSVGHDRRVSDEVFHFRQDRWEPWSIPEIGWPNPVDLDGLGVDRAIRVDLGAPRLALLPALAFTQHFDETDFDDDAGGSPGKRLLANERGVRGTLACRLRVEGDEPVETVEEIRHVHRGPPKQPQFLCVSLIDVTRAEAAPNSRRVHLVRRR